MNTEDPEALRQAVERVLCTDRDVVEQTEAHRS